MENNQIAKFETKKISDPIELEEPIIRGEGDAKEEIKEIRLRRPDTGAMRGCNLAELQNMNVDEISMLLPRISIPPITDVEVSKLDGATLFDIGQELVSFFNSRHRLKKLMAKAKA